MVVCKVFHNIWSYWLGSLGGICDGVGAVVPPSPAVSQGLVPVCAFTPLWLQPRSCLDPREWVRGAVSSPQPLSWLLCAVLVLHPELGSELAGWAAGVTSMCSASCCSPQHLDVGPSLSTSCLTPPLAMLFCCRLSRYLAKKGL